MNNSNDQETTLSESFGYNLILSNDENLSDVFVVKGFLLSQNGQKTEISHVATLSNGLEFAYSYKQNSTTKIYFLLLSTPTTSTIIEMVDSVTFNVSDKYAYLLSRLFLTLSYQNVSNSFKNPSFSNKIIFPKGEGVKFNIITDIDRMYLPYTGIYDLKLKSFETVSLTHGNSIIEPGDSVMLRYIFIENVSDMPTPKQTPLSFTLLPSLSIQSHETLKGCSIPGSTVKKLDGELCLTVGDVLKDNFKQEPCDQKVEIGLGCFFETPKIQLFGFNETASIKVQYPVRIPNPIKHFTSLCVGGSSKIKLSVQNCGGIPLGSDASPSRQVSLKFQIDDATQGENVLLQYFEKKSSLEQPFSVYINWLQPNTEYELDVTIYGSESAEPYKGFSISIALCLQTLFGDVRVLQQFEIYYVFSLPFVKLPESNVLVLTHDNTRSHEFKQWVKLFKNINLIPTFYDVSLNYTFSLSTPISSTNRTLLEDFKGGIIFILNNPHRDGTRTIDYINKYDLCHTKSNIIILEDYDSTDMGTLLYTHDFGGRTKKVYCQEDLEDVVQNESDLIVMQRRVTGGEVDNEMLSLLKYMYQHWPEKQVKVTYYRETRSTCGCFRIFIVLDRLKDARVIRFTKYKRNILDSFSENTEFVSSIIALLPLNIRLVLKSVSDDYTCDELFWSFIFDVAEELICASISKSSMQDPNFLLKTKTIYKEWATLKHYTEMVFIVREILTIINSVWKITFSNRVLKIRTILANLETKNALRANGEAVAEDFVLAFNEAVEENAAKANESNSKLSKKNFLLEYIWQRMVTNTGAEMVGIKIKRFEDDYWSEEPWEYMSAKTRVDKKRRAALEKSHTDSMMDLVPIPDYDYSTE